MEYFEQRYRFERLGKLIASKLLVSETAKGPVRLHFSVESADALFPRLFGAQLAG